MFTASLFPTFTPAPSLYVIRPIKRPSTFTSRKSFKAHKSSNKSEPRLQFNLVTTWAKATPQPLTTSIGTLSGSRSINKPWGISSPRTRIWWTNYWWLTTDKSLALMMTLSGVWSSMIFKGNWLGKIRLERYWWKSEVSLRRLNDNLTFSDPFYAKIFSEFVTNFLSRIHLWSKFIKLCEVV